MRANRRDVDGSCDSSRRTNRRSKPAFLMDSKIRSVCAAANPQADEPPLNAREAGHAAHCCSGEPPIAGRRCHISRNWPTATRRSPRRREGPARSTSTAQCTPSATWLAPSSMVLGRRAGRWPTTAKSVSGPPDSSQHRTRDAHAGPRSRRRLSAQTNGTTDAK